MGLEKLTDRIYYYPHQPEFDRPMLAYVKGSKFSLAVDAGYSEKHVSDFYVLLKQEELEKPDFTVITHWHYDHTFGMHHIHGTSIAHCKTNYFLAEQQTNAANPNYMDILKDEDICFSREYDNISSLKIVFSDIEFQNEIKINLGDLTAIIFHTESPHSEDTVCVYIPEERVLFLGDSTSEDFFNNSYMDKEKLKKLVSLIEDSDCVYCVLSHAEPMNKEELLEYLYSVLRD